MSGRPLSRTHARGFALPTAIFLLVVLAALGGYMVSLSRSSQISAALDIQGARASQAARAGIEWAAWQVIDPQALQPAPTPCPASPTNLVLDATLAGFAVSVECTRSLEDDGAATVAVYEITATASMGAVGAQDRVERQIRATLAK